MAKIKAVPVAISDPALPFTPIKINGKTYKMVFTFGALALAEEKLIAKGFDVNLLVAMIRRTFSTTRTLFAASLYAYHPEVDFSEAQDWVTQDNIVEILIAIDKSWNKSMPDAEPDAPQQPAE